MQELPDNTYLGAVTDCMDIAHRMRVLMGADLDEYDMADKAREMDLSTNDLIGVWPILTSSERAAWKELLTLERPNAPYRP